jgi:tripartite-type tricarboxylate transporter receptor subunit TctC
VLLLKKSRQVKLLAALVVCFGASQSAVAQDAYPTRAIRFIVAFAPGGITDTIARLVAKGVSEKLGHTIIIENKGGAAGALGAKYVSAAEPDGYVFLVTTSALTLGAAAYANTVDPRTQLVPIAILATSPTVIATKRGTNSHNLSDYLSQQKDSLVSYASSGTGTVEHLTAAYVLRSMHATHVPFRSGGEALNAVLGSQVDLSTTPLGSAIAFVDNG